MKIRILLFLLIIALIAIKFTYYPSLSGLSLEGVQKIGEIPSLDNQYKLNVYLYGGVLLKSDYSYVYELEDLINSGEKKNILWLGPGSRSVTWNDNHTLLVDEMNVNIRKDTYDYRWDFNGN
ncbi:DUF5412 family protein [Bacillus sp. JJ1562]|uniref:DUF5412 family protein n=1 Tax=Bacillus sp. JJ1562 TaxID=3122960 RepID=UPI0030036D49